ncbi:MAG: hypothetical protein LBQ91_02185 [Oscillospiraceae bacterium]|nr:hypothetical protein [Oscillospiraceae bacterium]
MKITEFRQAIDEYFTECEEKSLFPDEAGLLLRLGITKDECETLLSSAKRGQRSFANALKNARLRRESLISRDIYASGKTTTGKVFLLKQPANGAADTRREDGQEFIIRIEGDADFAD